MAGRGSDSDSEDEEPTIAEESVVEKYKSAGEIANRKWNRTAVKWTLLETGFIEINHLDFSVNFGHFDVC